MPDTSISNLTLTTPATAAHRIPIAITPFGSGNNGYITPALILSYGTSAITGTTITATTALVGGTVAGTTGTFTGAMVGATSLALGASGGTTGSILMKGTTSGTVTMQSAAAAGTWSMTLPTTAGTNAYVLQTDGTGITSWVAQSGGGVTSVTGTANQITVTGPTTPVLSIPNAFTAPGSIAATTTITGTTITATTQLVGAKVSESVTAGAGWTITAGTAASAVSALDITQTWNNVAVTFKSIFLNVTDTTSAAGSLLMDLQAGGASSLTLASKGGPSGVGSMLTVGSGSSTNVGLKIGYSQNGYGAIYPGNATPAVGNYALLVEASGSLTRINSNIGGQVGLSINNNQYVSMTTAKFSAPYNNTLGSAGEEWGAFFLTKTVTAGGTTGAQTINKPTGTVNFAAAASALVVTNSLVATTSIIVCTVGTNDTTMKSVNAVAGAGSFTINANAAATAETRVNFIVTN